MLLQQTSNLLPGRHQRQNSTPTVLDNLDNFVPATHRRGLSSDQSGHTFRHHGGLQQEVHATSFEYPLGQQLTTTATMRETQQHPMARPGLGQQITYQQFDYTQALKETPRLAHGTGDFSNSYFTAPSTELNNHMQASLQQTYNMNNTDSYQSFDSTPSAGYLDGFGNGLDGQIGDVQFNELMRPNPMPYGTPSSASSRPTSSGRAQQPCTPPSQTKTAYFPMTPATTPYSQQASRKKVPHSRTTESSPSRRDPNLTIRASHEMQRGTSCQDNFTMMRQHTMSPALPSPTNTSSFEPRKSVDLAAFPQPSLFNMAGLKMNIPLWNEGYNASNYSPMSNAVSSSISSFNSSPEVTHMPLFEPLDSGVDGTIVASEMSRLSSSQSAMDVGSNASPAKQDTQPRSQSMSQIDDINECLEETGVTCDEIAAFISHPDGDNKWTCLYPHCGKKFGRRENVKAHVQTHLGDRQFRCKDCSKRFVRQHDLKRHANIHSGDRQYMCPCSSLFARHDALTRHRQRGMCIGAFAGTIKKVIKRGRPKKPRPDVEERLEKSAATRQKALKKLEKRAREEYESSITDSSASAYSSPEQFDSPFEQVSSPPELDISSSSPAAPKMPDYDVSFTEPLPMSFQPNTDFFTQDFDISASIAKDDSSKETHDSIFNEYLCHELDKAIQNDFVFDIEF